MNMSFFSQYLRITTAFLLVSLLALPIAGQSNRGGIVEHTIRKGETLYSLAQHYGVSLEQVYELNPWAKTQLREGDKILFPTGEGYRKITTSAPKTHIVISGETIYRICRTYGISEESLLAANPHISLDNFRVGTELCIPTSYTLSDTLQRQMPQNKHLEAEVEERTPVRILLMLPISTQPRHLEFYEGFLMGVNDLKRDGISMDIKVLDTSNDETVRDAIKLGVTNDRDVIIGGVTAHQIRLISSNIGENATYIIPFNATEGAWNGVQINQPQRLILDRVISAFNHKYEDKELVLIKSNDVETDDPLVGSLKAQWQEAGNSLRVVNLDEQPSVQFSSKMVLVPISSKKELAIKLFDRLSLTNQRPEIFGYPQWQVYGEEFAQRLHRQDATIYSTFFFAPEQRDSKQFLIKYLAWYNKKIANTYPKYSVLGYDLARYFVRSYAIYGKSYTDYGAMLPADGLQMDIKLERHPRGNGYINTKFYFVTYQYDGTINRMSL